MRCPNNHEWQSVFKFESWTDKGIRVYRRVFG